MSDERWLHRLTHCFDQYTMHMRTRLLELQPTRHILSSNGLGQEVPPPTPEEWQLAVSRYNDCVAEAILACVSAAEQDLKQIDLLKRILEIEEIDVDLKVRAHVERSETKHSAEQKGSDTSVQFLSSEDIQNDHAATAMVLARSSGSSFPHTSAEALHYILWEQSLDTRETIIRSIQKVRHKTEKMYMDSFVDGKPTHVALHVNNDPSGTRLVIDPTNFDSSALAMDPLLVSFRERREDESLSFFRDKMHNDSLTITELLSDLELRKAALTIKQSSRDYDKDPSYTFRDFLTDRLEEQYGAFPNQLDAIIKSYENMDSEDVHADIQVRGRDIAFLSTAASTWTQTNKTKIYVATTLASVVSGIKFVRRALALNSSDTMQHLTDLFVTAPSFLMLNTFEPGEGVNIWRRRIFDWLADTRLDDLDTHTGSPTTTTSHGRPTALSFATLPGMSDTLVRFLSHIASLRAIRTDGRP